VSDIDYAKATRRVFWLTAIVGLAGALLSWRLSTGNAGVSFGLGALGSLLNLWVWHALAARLAGRQGRESNVAAVLFAIRLLGLFVFGYVIVGVLNLQPLPAILGLLTSSAAVMAEMIIELASSWRMSR
jgi:ATP synthase I chain